MKIEEINSKIQRQNCWILGRTKKNGNITFQYDDKWLKNGFSIYPFSLPLTKEFFLNNHPEKFNGLFGVFWDSLPDDWGELLIRRMLNKYGINFDKRSPLQKLSIVNKNGLGTLEYEPNKNL